jgi:dipeptidyl aminopeptidase/acylaminoacyl peptidase
LTVKDFRSLVTLSSIDLSPNGKSVAFIQSIPDITNDRNETTLTVLDVSTGALKALSPKGRSADAPKWSPSGKQIAFLSESKDKTTQVFIVSVNGGKPREVTFAKNGVQQFAWDPTGDQLAYTTPDDPSNADALAHHDDLFDIHDVGLLPTGPSVPTHIWLIPSNGGPARRLTHGTWSVMENAAPFQGAASAPSWSADGKWIAFAKQANADNSDTDLSRIVVVNTSTGDVVDLTNASTYEYQPAFASNGDQLAYLRPTKEPLSRMDVWGGQLTNSGQGSQAANDTFTTDIDRDFSNFAFEPDGKSIIGLANEGIQAALFEFGQGRKGVRLDLGPLSPDEVTVGKTGAIAFIASTSTAGQEIYLLEKGGKPKPLTSFNVKLASRSGPASVEFKWHGSDGLASDGVLTYPVGYQPGTMYPLFIWIHGGPEAASTLGYVQGEQKFLRRALAAQGFIVFEPNYRGSDGLGNAFERAIFANPAEGPAKDILSGVDALTATGVVDPSHLTIGGHSYGGTLTSWLIGHDHRYKSAVCADGNYDWVSEYNCSNSGNMAWARDSLGGTPTQLPDLYRTSSSITYAGQISTPTIILTGLADQQVPFVQSFGLYHTLKDRGVEVRLVGLPGAEHSPSRPVQIERYYETIVEWVVSHNR